MQKLNQNSIAVNLNKIADNEIQIIVVYIAENKSEENENFPMETKRPNEEISKNNLVNVTKNEAEEEKAPKT